MLLPVRKLLIYLLAGLVMLAVVTIHDHYQQQVTPALSELSGDAAEALQTLNVKGRAPKTDYNRNQFGDGWQGNSDCDTRDRILQRDLNDIVMSDEGCEIERGTLHDPYTGSIIHFVSGPGTSDDVQIDHVVALSDAWQKGAQQLNRERRVQFANDPLELLAVDGQANQNKGDGDAATWLPPNKSFRCAYIARQIAIKVKYNLWVTKAERDAMAKILSNCPGQKLPA